MSEPRKPGDWSTKKRDPAPRGVFRHDSGAWAIRFTCSQGHVHQEKVGPIKSEAIQRYHDQRGRARRETAWCPAIERREARAATGRARLTFGEYAADYLAWSATVHRSRKTVRGEVARLVAAWGPLPLEAITTAEVERWLMGLRAGESPLSPSTVNRYRDRVSGMYKRARRLGLVERNPATGIPKSKEPGGRILYLAPPEEAAVRDALPAAVRPAFSVALHSGLRWSEQAALMWRDVDLLTGFLGIGRSKNGYSRRVPINAVVRAVLIDLAVQRRRPDDPDEPVFGLAYRTTARALERAVAHAAAQLRELGHDVARLEHFSWHGLRHSFASRLAMAGVDLRTLQELGGWKTLSMVQRYSHLSGDHLHAAVARLEPGAPAGLEPLQNFDETSTAGEGRAARTAAGVS